VLTGAANDMIFDFHACAAAASESELTAKQQEMPPGHIALACPPACLPSPSFLGARPVPEKKCKLVQLRVNQRSGL